MTVISRRLVVVDPVARRLGGVRVVIRKVFSIAAVAVGGEKRPYGGHFPFNHPVSRVLYQYFRVCIILHAVICVESRV